MKEDWEEEGGEKDPECHCEAAGQASGGVADEGREDDQWRWQDTADREPVDELGVGQPTLSPAGGGSR